MTIEARTTQWKRIVVETVAIVASILFAFAIDAWWDASKQDDQEQAFLVALLGDFEEARNRIDISADAHRTFVDAGRQLLDLQDRGAADVEHEALETMLGAVFFDWRSLYLPSGSRDALFASGDIEIISNEELRSMLAGWPSRVADSAEDEVLIANDVMFSLAPYLQNKVRTRNVARFTSADAAEHISLVESVDYSVLWTDPKFENLVTSRILNETYAIRENVQLREAADEIIRVIEKELDR